MRGFAPVSVFASCSGSVAEPFQIPCPIDTHEERELSSPGAPGPLLLPRTPRGLRLPVEREWHGAPCPDRRLHGLVRLSLRRDGLEVQASLPHQPVPRVPDAAPGTRVARLFDYDVVECFLVGRGGAYLEVELGAGGHFLVLSFRAPRVRADEHLDFDPALRFESGSDRWRSTLVLPGSMLPTGIRAANAFVIAAGHFLAHHPLPGPEPDFHQPARFPEVRLSLQA